MPGPEPRRRQKNNDVDHPSHYTTGKIEVWDFIIDQRLSYCLGNVVKYVCRAGKKHRYTTIEDLEKAVAYLNREIKRLRESGEDAWRPMKPIEAMSQSEILKALTKEEK